MHLWILFRLSLRNVWREARRSILTCSAMALGLALLVFSRAMADGGHEDWIDSGVRMGSGHVVVQAPGHLESGDLDDRLTGSQIEAIDVAVADARADSVARESVVRLGIVGLASSATAALPVRVEGVDPESEIAFSDFADKLVEGRYLEPDDRLQAFVGVGLAERLNLRIGSRFVVTAQAASGDIEGQLVRVAGMFRTGLVEADEGIVHIPISTARTWLGVDGATSVGVLVEDSRWVEQLETRLNDALEGEGVRVITWREASPELDAAVRMDDYGDYVFRGILFAIIALSVLNSVLMGVLHRKREFGVLQALGLTPGETGWVVLVEGMLLTALAGVVGVILGIVLTWVFFRNGLDFSFALEGEFEFAGIVLDPVIIPEFRVSAFIQSVYSILIVGLVASVYPALQAMRIDVAESMKFER